MSADRRSARILALQALCQWDVQGDESTERLLELFRALDAPPATLTYATQLVESFWRRKAAVDAKIAATSPQWDLERMTLVDRNVLRVGVVELSVGEVPPKVAIDEAIEIAREYGGGDSPRFVNGVLDSVYRQSRTDAGSG